MEIGPKAKRLRMVEEQIVRRGLEAPALLEAFRRVPRHRFVPTSLRNDAYRDCPLPIGENQTISQPYMVASMTSAARLVPGEKVLEIGTGSGYQTAILAEMGMNVYTVERIEVLSMRAQRVLKRLKYPKIHFLVGDGTLGWTAESPFDAILVTAGAPSAPQPLLDQLAQNGRLVVPIEEGYSQVLYVFVKTTDGVVSERGERCTFVPLIGKFGWDR